MKKKLTVLNSVLSLLLIHSLIYAQDVCKSGYNNAVKEINDAHGPSGNDNKVVIITPEDKIEINPVNNLCTIRYYIDQFSGRSQEQIYTYNGSKTEVNTNEISTALVRDDKGICQAQYYNAIKQITQNTPFADDNKVTILTKPDNIMINSARKCVISYARSTFAGISEPENFEYYPDETVRVSNRRLVPHNNFSAQLIHENNNGSVNPSSGRSINEPESSSPRDQVNIPKIEY